VDLEIGSIPRATVTCEDVPGRLQVACGIADVEATEVDDRRQPAIDDEQVAGQQSAVYPYLVAVPGRGVERLLPRAEGGVAVDSVAELCDRLTDLLVELREWCAPTTRRTRMCPGRVDPAQGVHERGEIDGGLIQ